MLYNKIYRLIISRDCLSRVTRHLHENRVYLLFCETARLYNLLYK